MQIYLYFNNKKDQLRLPVNPPEVNTNTGRNYDDSTVVGLGEVTSLGGTTLDEISFSSFFPRDYNPTYCEYSGFLTPTQFVNEIERFKNHPTLPCRLVITGAARNINTAVTIRSFDHREVAGTPGDIAYDITFKVYRIPTVSKVKLPAPPPPPRIAPVSAATATKPKPKPKKPAKNTGGLPPEQTSHRPAAKETITSIFVAAGESLQATACRVWGSSEHWMSLAKYNAIQAPYRITASRTLRVPNAAQIRLYENEDKIAAGASVTADGGFGGYLL
jgi:hypothetical protein